MRNLTLSISCLLALGSFTACKSRSNTESVTASAGSAQTPADKDFLGCPVSFLPVYSCYANHRFSAGGDYHQGIYKLTICKNTANQLKINHIDPYLMGGPTLYDAKEMPSNSVLLGNKGFREMNPRNGHEVGQIAIKIVASNGFHQAVYEFEADPTITIDSMLCKFAGREGGND